MKQCVICGKQGEKHHIVFKNQGGLDFPLNYIYLCSEHHRGKEGPHKNRKIDIKYKVNLQNKLINILKKDYYTMEEIMEILKINPRQAKMITKDFSRCREGYKRKDIIKRLMGRRFYHEFMLDKYYDESWNIFEDEMIELELKLK
ncbi:HNH endonuclease [Haloimpatiens sp. FM7330]|uniref:HNH endonuclease n=1 Tax=Haloimpatiens sp. FM7330 TaxID=3298610 RepID=UPI0036391C04